MSPSIDRKLVRLRVTSAWTFYEQPSLTNREQPHFSFMDCVAGRASVLSSYGYTVVTAARAVYRAGKAINVLLHSPTQAQYVILTGRIHDRRK
jgi:hypothetical protein